MKTNFLDKYGRFYPYIILVSCLIAYTSVYSAGFIWDDDDYIINNPVLRDLTGLGRIWFDPTSLPQYYPMVHSTFWIEYQLWGLDPFGYHLVNIVLHGFNAILVYKIVKHLEIQGALFIALLFAVHPVHVESVAWVTERKNVLSALFYLLALRSYLKWRPIMDVESSGSRYGILAFAFFLAALASKTVTLSLPAVVLLLIYWKRGAIMKADWIKSLPFFVVGILFGSYTSFLERTHVMAVGTEFDFSFVERLLIAGRACWFYAGKLLYPFPISFNYYRWDIDAGLWWQWIFPIGVILLLGLLLFFRKRIGRGPLVAILFFGGTLFPALGFFNIFPMRYSFVADHFQYLASLGILCLFGSAATIISGKYISNKVQSFIAGSIILVLSILTFQQGKVYKGHETLWRDTLEKNPSSWIAMSNLAKTLMDEGKKEEPISLLTKSIAIRPSFESHLNLGVLVFENGQQKEAEEHFGKAIALKPNQPIPYNNKAYVLMKAGAFNEALILVNKALLIDPDYSDARATRGLILYSLGKMKDAYADLKIAMKVNPGNLELLLPIANAAFRTGDQMAALKWSANAVAKYNNDSNAQTLFSQVLIKTIMDQQSENRIATCQNLYSQIGTSSRPGFVSLVNYMHQNNLSKEASEISKALGLGM